ncbi:RNA polymerase II holoenzyme cyclin-like subunit [Wickerhamomyces ciferrii]|uniref:RNA polymerase II holoenzyme cyclin-like subunit n=1 Tax=Wickerhamomyces ciferrii (strain ATCC 14091 / BCRC 22168 / CBS 111 / JCM 3599 / NBRC 0793 / NRRL Y-1031 F-60-10) TaxID=1206466 RepID=K0KLM9_WICCF|nr:RNA polymerase II holoenzyme cyclin-like subunit [Wickerhamomyces ciferrii]CCH42028.1 RNA polymerase II holoenzyme cyclin-like subunit [Wickerhamomyces ciferrii]
MAADFWSSTQRMNWQFSRDSLKDARRELSLLENTMEQSELISKVKVNYDLYMRIYIHSLVNKLGRRLNVRQIALSTAEVYLLRFLTKVSLKEVNLYLLITTSIYLSCKIEECPQHIRTIVSEARNLWPEYIPHDATKVAEFEFYLIEEMDTYLIVHHPYRSLLLINEVLSNYNQSHKSEGHNHNNNSNNNNDTSQPFALSPEELQSCWSIINDSYVTDLPLIHAPHIIASASIFLTIVLKYNHLKHISKDSLKNSKPNTMITEEYLKSGFLKNFIKFLGYSNIDLGGVIEAVQELITLYEIWETYDESSCKKPLESVLLNR